MLDLVFQNLTTDKQFNENFFKKILEIAGGELKLVNKNISVSLNLVGEGKIKELNKKHMNKNKVTDVLSFPMEESGDMGDIFICLPFAKKEAKSENVDIEMKLAQLTVHGFLHLAGYDHEKSEQEAEKMFKLENKILDKLNG
ncbi:MAG: rRNA maturation RNase YbeY [Candidatus Yanofskybacteria bacterium RIFCSPHIGHO2_02_FULL_38_22b]|uniref:Endoribonuclease YbeY n=1 Tax=Candidatus Yanofskybacteria bacterium RIFCSPHIGHO2_02_FULL_38_22b TaxID=1802673 RepID=A0A1F8F4G4_9BACT|nr:MAG: rRNA maturation RNase YbeY [Candidatus Yanofskybacteria bacterium RIFCSPHIGHO2_01_FULL_39_44]OGN07136.1 MAG: rRNA maturation RNase YbeY [Candidatus Yanofskybacteria bacterium RIFCSPHIGHO2_02_FULL_38_22b]OGN19986.1 MAG: rRNA maturation RNase YbeY [Candidatus Yanofskybacteria bacterium RIFCSPLOWO2_01_FULL_39_28]